MGPTYSTVSTRRAKRADVASTLRPPDLTQFGTNSGVPRPRLRAAAPLPARLETYELPGDIAVIGHSGTAPGYATMMFQRQDNDAILVTGVNTGNLFWNALDVFIPAMSVISTEAQ